MQSENHTAGQRTFVEAARRAQIVQSAIDTIADVGYAQASLAQIAARVGISKGVISYHFDGKDELIRQVTATVFEAGAAFMTPRILAQSEPASMLRVYIEANLEFIKSNRTSLIALVDILVHQPPEAAGEDAQPVMDGAVEGLQRLFAGGQQAGAFREFDVTVMARTLRAAIDVVPGRLAVEPDLDIDAYAAELVATFALATRR